MRTSDSGAASDEMESAFPSEKRLNADGQSRRHIDSRVRGGRPRSRARDLKLPSEGEGRGRRRGVGAFRRRPLRCARRFEGRQRRRRRSPAAARAAVSRINGRGIRERRRSCPSPKDWRTPAGVTFRLVGAPRVERERVVIKAELVNATKTEQRLYLWEAGVGYFGADLVGNGIGLGRPVENQPPFPGRSSRPPA